MMNFLKNLDQFGVAYQPKIHYTTSEYKTVYGGIMSVLLYGLSFSYLLYLIIQWQQGAILPKVTTLSNVEQNYRLQLNEKYLEIELRKYRYTSIDPFNPQAIILQPVLYYFVNGEAPSAGYPQNIVKNFNSFGFNRVDFKNLTAQISSEQTTENPLIEMMLVFGMCQQYYLLDGQQCADNTTINKFFNQKTNTLIVKQVKKEFNTNTVQLDDINKEMIVPLQKNSTFYSQINVKISTAQVDQGILFEDFNSFDFIVDYESAGSMMDESYFQSILNYETYAVFYYKIDEIQTISQIVYPKLSEVLADAGSIASTLLLLSYLMILLNSSYFQFETVNQIISMYYPEFKNVKIYKNVFGKIIKVESQGKLVNLDYFLPYYEKLRKIGEIKLTISNQIYEMSRIQFILQYLHSRKFLQKFHKTGIPLQVFQYEQISGKEQNQFKADNSIVIQEQNFKLNQILPNIESQDFKLKKSFGQTRKQSIVEIVKPEQNSDKTHNSHNIETDMIDQFLTEGDFDILSFPQDVEVIRSEQKENESRVQQVKQDSTNADLLQQIQNE